MSIASEVERISANVQNTIDTIKQTGVTVPEGANSDNLPALAQDLANEKQNKLTGTQGQYVGFNSNGEAVAVNPPSSTKAYITTTDKTVPTSAWSSDSTYADLGFNYRASVSVSDVTTSYIPDINFSPADQYSGNLASFADTYIGGVYIYAKTKPTETVTIESAIFTRSCWR